MVVTAAVFGPKWKGRLIQFSVDNLAVVHILNSTYSKDAHLMHLIHILVFLAAHFDFWFVAKHIEGRANSLADHLSRNHLHNFFSQVPQAEHHPPPHIPAQLLDLLGNNHLVWTSTDWIGQFKNSIKQLFPNPHTRLTRQQSENIYLSVLTFHYPPYLPQKTFYAILQPVLGKRAWQVPPSRPIYPVSVRFRFQLASLIHGLTKYLGFARSLRASEFKQSRMEDPLVHAFLSPPPSFTSSGKFD